MLDQTVLGRRFKVGGILYILLITRGSAAAAPVDRIVPLLAGRDSSSACSKDNLIKYFDHTIQYSTTVTGKRSTRNKGHAGSGSSQNPCQAKEIPEEFGIGQSGYPSVCPSV